MGRAEQIRGVLDTMDANAAKDALAMLLAQSSLSSNSQSVYSNSASSKSASGNIKSIDSVDFANFAQAITYLKSKFKFKELSRFTTEADLVYVDTGDRKVLLTDRDDPKRFESQQPARRPVSQTYESEDEYFNNAFEPAYHRATNQQQNSSNSTANPEQQTQTNVEKSSENNDNLRSDNAPSDADPFDNKKNGNSRFSSLEL